MILLKNKIYYYLTIFGIILISFFLYSSRFYPALGSDDALNVLMAHYYQFPDDMYCWGQDRGGTLLPLISQFFIKVFNVSALTGISLAAYLVLVLGFIGFSGLLKKDSNKIILAATLFLPVSRFIDLLRYPIGMEYGLLGISIALERKFCMKCLEINGWYFS